MTLNEIYQFAWVFFIYAFLGWCVEVVFHAVSEGKFVNRGFLNGPICPIYGFGVLTVVLCLEPLKDNLLLLFIGSVFITTFLEFVTGFILEKFFNDKWWDYSNEPLNILGYVCLRFSLIWGLACLFVVDIIYPFTTRLIEFIPHNIGIIFLCLFIILAVTDNIITLTETLRLKRKLVFLENTEKRILRVSDGIGGALAQGTLTAMEKLEESIRSAEIKKTQAATQLSAVQKRILNSYPHLKQGRFKDSIAMLKLHLKNESNISEKKAQISSSLPIPDNDPLRIYQSLPISLYRSTFEAVIDVLEARDSYTAGHSKRVAVLTKRFCEQLNIPPLEAEVFEIAASLHDLGKVGIADATLLKCGKLNENEWTEMRRHSDIGADIILKTGKLEHIADIIRHHHEHWDASGYPSGLLGDEIPKGAQIIAICDAVDSMMLERVYRDAFSPDECKSEIEKCKGTFFRRELADVFLDNWDQIVIGLYSEDNEYDYMRSSVYR